MAWQPTTASQTSSSMILSHRASRPIPSRPRSTYGRSAMTKRKPSSTTRLCKVLPAIPACQLNDRRRQRRSTMPRLAVFALAAIAASTVATRPGSAQSDPRPLKEQLVATWTFISSTTKLAGGGALWGDHPKGITIFTVDGHFSSHVMRADRPKFRSNNRGQGKADEHKAAVIGAFSSFGTYTVDEANK